MYLVRQTLALSEEIRFLCKPDCKGLCPVCGRNLNIDPCACGASVLHLVTDDEEAQEDNTQKPFAALQDLLSRNEEV